MRSEGILKYKIETWRAIGMIAKNSSSALWTGLASNPASPPIGHLSKALK